MSSRMLGQTSSNFAAIAPDLDYLRGLPRLPEVYDEFSTGDYRNFSLWNSSGSSTDSRYRDISDATARTAFGDRTPGVETLLRSIFRWENVTMVRARNLMNATIFPHRDFIELDRPASNYFRAFLALDSAPYAFHSDGSGVFQMQPGEIWFIDAASVHSAANLMSHSRLHLCIDLAFDHVPEDAEIFADGAAVSAPVAPTYKTNRYPLPKNFDAELAGFGRLLTPATLVDLLSMLTRTHYLYDSRPEDVWDWLTTAAHTCPFEAVRRRVADLREHVLNCRDFESGMDISRWAPSAFELENAA